MMGDVIAEARSLIMAPGNTSGKDTEAENVRRLKVSLQELVCNANMFLKENNDSVNNTIDNLAVSVIESGTFLDVNEVLSNKIEVNSAEVSRSATELTDRISRITLRIEKGEGTLDKSIADDPLDLDLRDTINILDSSITDFKKKPGRYMKVSIF